MSDLLYPRSEFVRHTVQKHCYHRIDFAPMFKLRRIKMHLKIRIHFIFAIIPIVSIDFSIKN